jgi:hypothetical protein
MASSGGTSPTYSWFSLRLVFDTKIDLALRLSADLLAD